MELESDKVNHHVIVTILRAAMHGYLLFFPIHDVHRASIQEAQDSIWLQWH
jgi:hypothetical protein